MEIVVCLRKHGLVDYGGEELNRLVVAICSMEILPFSVLLYAIKIQTGHFDSSSSGSEVQDVTLVVTDKTANLKLATVVASYSV